jgi:hypothetical protein
MKKTILIAGLTILVITNILTGCENNSQKSGATPAQSQKEQYRCPMKCTEEIFDKPGKCPVCEMELEKVIKS